MSKNIVSVLAVIILTACGGGGSGSLALTDTGPTYPANGTKSGDAYCGTDSNEWTLYQDYHDGNGGTYTTTVEENSATCGWKELPNWQGENYSEYDNNSDQYAIIEYNRKEYDEYDLSALGLNLEGNTFYKYKNTGLLYSENTGWRNASTWHPNEKSDAGYFYSYEKGPAPINMDINGDGLMDMMFAHRLGPNHNDWLPRAKLIPLINQGNGRLQVDPDVFSGYEIPFAGNMYVSHVADLNGDGHDDFINIGEDPVMLLSEYGGLVDYTEQLKLQMTNMGSVDAEKYSQGLKEFDVWTHTTAVGDLNGDGTLDLFVPSAIVDQNHNCPDTPHCTAFTMLNDGTGNFTLGSVNLPYLAGVGGSYIDDFDKDGYGDIAVLYSESDYHPCDNCNGYVMYGNADGDYTRDIRPLPKNNNSQNGSLQIIGADINGDGLTDLITGHTDTEGYYVGHQYQIFINYGDGDWGNETIHYVVTKEVDGHPTHGVQLAYAKYIDINGDGNKDIVSTGSWSSPIYVWDNGQFVMQGRLIDYLPYAGTTDNCDPTEDTTCGAQIQGHNPIDIDGDNILDFVQVIEYGSDQVSGIILSQIMGKKLPF
tara:strand:+ start:15943 stop:17721 length:1779 start_codon:yes stop_codon:yes gene_type:complete